MIKKIFISLLVLLGFGLSFSSSNYVNFGSPIELFGDNVCNVGSDLSFNCSKSGPTLSSLYDRNNIKNFFSIFWIDGGIGGYHSNDYSVLDHQGYVNTGFYICSGDTSSVLSGSTLLSFDGNLCNVGYTRVLIGSFDDLINKLTSKTPRLIYSSYPYNYISIFSLVYDDFYFTILTYIDANSFYLTNGTYINENLGLTGYDFDNLSYGSNIKYSPLGGSINGGSQEVSVITPYTGDLIKFNCTKSLALAWYRYNGYNDKMCYSSYGNTTDLYSSGVGAFSLTGIDIYSVWLDTAHYQRYGNYSSGNMSYQDWFKYWRKTYNVYKKNSTINNPFSGVPFAIFSQFANIDVYGLPYTDDSILEFCNLSLYDSDLSVNYSGVASDVVCNLSRTQVAQIYGNSIGVTGVDSVLGSSWDGITNRSGFHAHSGSPTVITDGSTFLNSYFNLLKGSFKFGDTNNTPLLPRYIIIGLMAFILFRFLKKR